MTSSPLWDIFCVVVDNYGDIGVTWRLARQLVAQHNVRVRLWVDDLDTFHRLCPAASAAEVQCQAGVEVHHWSSPWASVEPADVVIEAFACNLPREYVRCMRAAGRRILWLNLEYLSAEDWIVGCHGLPSLQPCGLPKYFFFPGFQPESGGVTRERGLIAQRRAFQADSAAQTAFLAGLGVVPIPGARRVSLFAYENLAVPGWLDALARSTAVTQLLVPEGRVLRDVKAWLGAPELRAGDRVRQGGVEITVLPFVSQEDYDRLLWCCQFNAVRGEESFIRAQWGGEPFVWHIYPQEEGAHWTKLWAFFDLYTAGLESQPKEALRAFWAAWNAGEGAGEAWPGLMEHAAQLKAHAEQWVDRQEAQGDLAGKLVSFYSDWL